MLVTPENLIVPGNYQSEIIKSYNCIQSTVPRCLAKYACGPLIISNEKYDIYHAIQGQIDSCLAGISRDAILGRVNYFVLANKRSKSVERLEHYVRG